MGHRRFWKKFWRGSQGTLFQNRSFYKDAYKEVAPATRCVHQTHIQGFSQSIFNPIDLIKTNQQAIGRYRRVKSKTRSSIPIVTKSWPYSNSIALKKIAKSKKLYHVRWWRQSAISFFGDVSEESHLDNVSTSGSKNFSRVQKNFFGENFFRKFFQLYFVELFSLIILV